MDGTNRSRLGVSNWITWQSQTPLVSPTGCFCGWALLKSSSFFFFIIIPVHL
jgi:hypothetical protein